MKTRQMIIGVMIVLGMGYLISPVAQASAGNFTSSGLLNKTNQSRKQYGLAGLRLNKSLSNAAQAKAQDMASKSYFSHQNSTGARLGYWINQSGYKYNEAGENLGVNFFSNTTVQKAWMSSLGHRANILNSRFEDIGFGWAEGWYEGKRTVFVVEMLGSPAP